MTSARRLIQLIAITVVVVGSLPSLANEQGAPVYQRNRQYGQHRGWGYHGGGYFHGGSNFAAPFVTGSWYARPYPYHFDYFRWRYSAPPMAPPPECPCAEAPLAQ